MEEITVDLSPSPCVVLRPHPHPRSQTASPLTPFDEDVQLSVSPARVDARALFPESPSSPDPRPRNRDEYYYLMHMARQQQQRRESRSAPADEDLTVELSAPPPCPGTPEGVAAPPPDKGYASPSPLPCEKQSPSPTDALAGNYATLERLWEDLKLSVDRGSSTRSASYDRDISPSLPRLEAAAAVTPAPAASCFTLSSKGLLCPEENTHGSGAKHSSSPGARPVSSPSGGLSVPEQHPLSSANNGGPAVGAGKVPLPKVTRFSCRFCGAAEELTLHDEIRRIICFCPFCGMRA